MQDQPNQERTAGAATGTAPRPQSHEPMNLADKAERAAEQAKSAAIDRVQTVRDQAQTGLDQGRGLVAARIRHVSAALKSAGNELDKEDETIARYVTAASSRVDSIASYVSTADPTRVLRDVQDLARDKPAWFFGGAFLLGLAAGRFLRASQEGGASRRTEELDESDFLSSPSTARADAYRRQQNYADRPYASPPRPSSSAPRPIQPSATVPVTGEPRVPAPGMPRGPNYT